MIRSMRRLLYVLLAFLALSLTFSACDNGAPPNGSAVRNRDSLPVMVTYGVSKLISDSGVVRYKILSEEWLVFDRTHPPRQEFRKGVLLQRYDDRLNVALYITADTAYWYNQSLWELRGRVRGDRFRSDEQLTRYEVKRTRGYIPMPSAFGNSPAPAGTTSR